MKKIEVVPVGYVKNTITETGQPGNKDTESFIIISDMLPADAFANLEFFSHLEIIYYFDLHGNPEGLSNLSNYPENEKSERKKNYGSSLFGTAIVRLLKKEQKTILVHGLDALNGTLVIDIKPVMSEFLPKDEIIQPEWSKKISGNY